MQKIFKLRGAAPLLAITRTGEEIHLNSQMLLDGMAYHYAQYSDSCPNRSTIARGEERAKDGKVVPGPQLSGGPGTTGSESDLLALKTSRQKLKAFICRRYGLI